MTLDVDSLNSLLLAGAVVLLVAILALRLSVAMGLPGLLVYLLIGVLMGDAGMGIKFSDADLAVALGMLALVIILAEGGLTTTWKEVRPVLRMGVALATVGVAVSVLIVALVAHFLLGMHWQIAVLLGAVSSSTDAAAVFSVLRRVPISRRLSGILEAESGLNDAPVVVLVTLISLDHTDNLFLLLGEIFVELTVGVLGGVVVGYVGAWVLRRISLPSSGLYAIAVLSMCVLAYAGSSVGHGSGFAAVYVAGVILGNADLPHRQATRSFAEGTAWIAQIGLFVMLGLLVSPAEIAPREVALAVAAGIALTFVARPVSVFVSSLFQPMPWRRQIFVSMAGLRGAVPIVLATIPWALGVAGAKELFDIVFVMVVISTLLTGPALPRLAKALGISQRSEPRDLDVEAAPLERIAADLLQIMVTPNSLMHGVEVGELRLPKGASVSMIVRDGVTKVPELRTVLRHGDEVLVVTPRKHREATEARLKEVSGGGRLAKWLGPADRPRR